jgi:hypothetical protein
MACQNLSRVAPRAGVRVCLPMTLRHQGKCGLRLSCAREVAESSKELAGVPLLSVCVHGPGGRERPGLRPAGNQVSAKPW